MENDGKNLDLKIAEDGGWIRRKSLSTTFATIFAAAFSLFYAGLFVLGLTTVSSLEELPEMLAIATAAVGIPIVLPALLAARMSRAGIQISAAGVVVRGPVRTWHVPLQEGLRFVPGRQESVFAGELLRCTYGVLLERQKGRPVPIWALRSTQWTNEEGLGAGEQLWQPVCDRLNRMLADTKDGGPPSPFNLPH